MEATLYTAIQSKLSDISSILSVTPRQLLGGPSREGATVQVPAQCGSSISGDVNIVEPPSTGGSQGGEGLADPAVLCFLEIAGQDSSLVLQLLYRG